MPYVLFQNPRPQLDPLHDHDNAACSDGGGLCGQHWCSQHEAERVGLQRFRQEHQAVIPHVHKLLRSVRTFLL